MSQAEEKPFGTPPAASIDAKLLLKIRSETFSPRDWRRLATACLDVHTRRALGHLSRITPRLVRQLAHVPGPLMRPRALYVLNRLRLTPGRWRALRTALAEAGPQRRATLAALAGRIRAVGDFWDYWHEAVQDSTRPFTLSEEAFGSALLAPLTDPAMLRAEGRRMGNCLGGMAADVHAGTVICFRPRSLAHVTAELVAQRGAWRVGRILGHSNADLDPAVSAPLRAELQRLAARLNPCAPPPPDELDSPQLQEIRAWARARYSAATLQGVAQLLRDIRGRSVEVEQGAFAIFTVKPGVYVQFLARLDGTGFLCEVSSHKYEPLMHSRLAEPVVALIEQARLRWPQGEQNFSRRFVAVTEDDVLALAEFALAMLGRIGRLRPGGAFTRKGHIPPARAPQTPSPGWTVDEVGLDLADELIAGAPDTGGEPG